MKGLLVDWIFMAGLALLLLVLAASILYLAWCVLADAENFYDYLKNRNSFRLWKWRKEQEGKEPLEVREKRCLAELRQIQKEMARRDGRRSAMQVYTFTAPGWKREQI